MMSLCDNAKNELLRMLSDKTRNNLLLNDFRVSLFSSALTSYRCDSVVKPFPNLFVNSDQEKQFPRLCSSFVLIPRLAEINGETDLESNSWLLLHWILTNGLVRLELRSFDDQQINEILADQCNRSVPNYKPSYIFEVKSQPKKKFIDAKQQYGTFWAFHGSKAENFYSILNNGLVNCLNKRDLYGSGTYLSSQLSVAIEFSPFGFGWTKSLLFSEISCVAVCEVIKHPIIKQQNSTNAIPNAYYLIQNDDFVNISYLLVYCKNRSSSIHNQNTSFSLKKRIILSVVSIGILLAVNWSWIYHSLKRIF